MREGWQRIPHSRSCGVLAWLTVRSNSVQPDPMKQEQPWRGARPKKKQRGGGSFLIQNNRYVYDLVGNILKVENQLPIIRNALGGASSYEYQYDNLNRLTHAKGNYTGELTSASYELKMSYNNLNSITKKELNHLSGGVQKGYTLDYSYNNPAHPHAPSEIMEMGKPKARTYQYDGNGNPVYYEESKSFRSMVWDEENRLRGINDNGKLHLYTYDHTGERAVKSSGESSTVVTNGLTSAVITHMDDYTAYVNPYFVVQKGKFTKHYFEGSARIVSKLGEGTFVHKNTGIMAGGIDYIRQNAQMQEARDNYIRGLKVPPGPPTQHGIYASPEWTGQPYPSLGWQNIRQDQEPPEGWPRPPKFNEPGDVPGPPVQYGDPITPQTVKAGYGFIDNGIIEKNLYFYHPDHLGSSSYITDREGRITQHTEYIAFGEVLFEEHSTSKTMPYLFNGKELDTETGLYYYGARYYDPRVSIFLNVDPLAEKTMTPYAYTYNNPINLIDPTGMKSEDWVEDKNGNITWRKDVNEKNYQSVLKEGEIYRGKYYERTKNWDNRKHKGLVLEIYHTYKKMSYSRLKELSINISGIANKTGRKDKIGRDAYFAEGRMEIIATFGNNKSKVIHSSEINSGPWDYGPTPNGEYQASGIVNTRESGMVRDNVGFKILLNDHTELNRTGLRIHPDQNPSLGTAGCIGICENANKLIEFRNIIKDYFDTINKPFNVSIHFRNNPNYSRPKGGKATSGQ